MSSPSFYTRLQQELQEIKDAGLYKQERIIESAQGAEITVNGKQVFAADFEPAVSANPYIQFKFKADESGDVVLTWTDDDGSTIVGKDSITVA